MPNANVDPDASEPSPMKFELFSECEMELPETRSFAAGTLSLYTRRCPDKESPNEDSMAIFQTGPDSGVLVVADGLGGARAGHLASAIAVQAIRDAIDASAETRRDLRPAVLDGIENANRQILELGIGAATTLAIVEINGTTIRPYHVGDSMILLMGQKGRHKLETMAHSPVGHALQAGMIDEDEAMQHEERHLVTNCVGSGNMRIEIGSSIEMSSRDTLVLASDGLSDNMAVSDIIETLRCGNLTARSEQLVSRARTQMQLDNPESSPCKPDDLTVIVYRRNIDSTRSSPRAHEGHDEKPIDSGE